MALLMPAKEQGGGRWEGWTMKGAAPAWPGGLLLTPGPDFLQSPSQEPTMATITANVY